MLSRAFLLVLIALIAAARPAAADQGPPTNGWRRVETSGPEDGTGQADSCPSTQGRIELGELEAEGQPRPLPFRIYLPPCYDSDGGERYPVLYLLHGLLGTDSQWDELGVDEAADALIAEGALPPILIVMPWERTGLRIEEALVDGLIDRIDESYRTRAQAQWRAIGGLSRGAGQALEIGLRHPDLFGQISLHSPAVLHDDVLLQRWLNAIPADTQPAIWIDIGLRDSLFPSAEHLIEFFFQQGIAPTLQFNEGDHLPVYWEANLQTYLRWHGGLWQAEQLKDEMREAIPQP